MSARLGVLERDDWIYELVLRTPEDLDDELRAWLAAAYLVSK